MSQPVPVGLCERCGHGRRIDSSKGSVFWLCDLARTDARFRKYPPLPVRSCPGWVDPTDEKVKST